MKNTRRNTAHPLDCFFNAIITLYLKITDITRENTNEQ